MRIGKFHIGRQMVVKLRLGEKTAWRCERFGPIWISWEET